MSKTSGNALNSNAPHHVDIQAYEIQGVRHFRARVHGEDWRYENNAGENLNQFRYRLMDSLNSGIITHFIEDWKLHNV